MVVWVCQLDAAADLGHDAQFFAIKAVRELSR